ncbi:MAG: isocitrate/isopropylmalate dehydrogenase family protein [Candidatus Omnitrophica bacterium]|nr:isocitrate/isopropylmalate dehydrogenase family protein [Candidatus Omnitrophota bacterium]
MKHRVTLIPGDGIGPEVVSQAVRCIEATGVDIEWDVVTAGEEALKKYNELLPKETISSIRENKVALKGPLTTPIGEGFYSINVTLRQIFNLYACVRPTKLYPGIKAFFKDVDIIVIRENTEDLYAGIEFKADTIPQKELLRFISKYTQKELPSDTSFSIKPISGFASERVIRFAFEYALKLKRKKVTCVHKANIMKFTDGLFLDTFRKISSEYKDKIIAEEMIVDNMAMHLVQRPQDYDVLVLPNLYGDIISDLCAGLVGGLGVAPGANFGDGMAIFEPVHGSAPKYAGKNKANPTAMILSGVMMLRYLKEDIYADKLEEAVRTVLKENRFVTYDLKLNRDDPTAVGTKEMADAIISHIK